MPDQLDDLSKRIVAAFELMEAERMSRAAHNQVTPTYPDKKYYDLCNGYVQQYIAVLERQGASIQ